MPVENELMQVSYENGVVQIDGAEYQRVKITAQKMLNRMLERLSQRSIDLLTIAAGSYAVDRIKKRSHELSNEGGTRVFRVCFHVSDHAYWSQESVSVQVSELLHFLTGDYWLLSFAKLNAMHVTTSEQRSIEFRGGRHPTTLALYSGGLDSAAGLASRLMDGAENYLLLTIGHQAAIRSRCVKQIRVLRGLLMQASTINHASFLINLEGGKSERMRDQETSQRARGFLFCCAAGIVANACDISLIEVFENGIGAINFPLSAGALIEGLSTRGAHPGFLEKMSTFLSSVFESDIKFRLPFIDMTKAEMVSKLVMTPRLVDWAQMSCSCIHTSLRVPGKRHCGSCPACIERLQAFRSAGIEENRQDYRDDIDVVAQAAGCDYLLCYLDNAGLWLEDDSRIKTRLEHHRILSDMENISQLSAENIHRRHATEAQRVYGRYMSTHSSHGPKTREKEPELA